MELEKTNHEDDPSAIVAGSKKKQPLMAQGQRPVEALRCNKEKTVYSHREHAS